MLARICFLLVLFVSTARADGGAVALLPLDAGAKFEVYGQALASEISKTLSDAKIDVVVVVGKMTVPDNALLVIDGKISQGKAGAIELSIRVRDPKSGKIIQTFPVVAPSLGKLDKAVVELSQQVLPVVRENLEALSKKPIATDPVKPPPPIKVDPPKGMPARPLLVGVKGADPFRGALADAVNGWAGTARRAPTAIDAISLDAKTITKTVAGSNADRAIAFEVLGYSLWGDKVPMGKARVRVRIADAAQIIFDRVVVTDTVVGDAAMPTDAFATRVAREVLSILRPHVRKAVPGWP